MNYKKSYDFFSQTWVIQCMKIYEISGKVINFIMKNWKAELAEGQTREEVKYHRGLFHENSLSPLLCVIAMMPLNYILMKYTGG